MLPHWLWAAMFQQRSSPPFAERQLWNIAAAGAGLTPP
jgi:hypothetical protein